MDPKVDLAVELDPKVKVDFKRETTDGVLSKVWVDDLVLNFKKGKAWRKLHPNKHYVIEWEMVGNVGDTLSITRTALGTSKKVVDSSTILVGSRHHDYTVDKF